MTNSTITTTLVLNAYQRLTRDELLLFAALRSLPQTGSHTQLAKRIADFDLRTFPHPDILPVPDVHSQPQRQLSETLHVAHHLPLELVAEIIDSIPDWELAQSLSLPTTLTPPREWLTATSLDLAILSGNIQRIRRAPAPFSTFAVKAAIRFSFVDVLDYLAKVHSNSFERHMGPNGRNIPYIASEHGRTAVLAWWRSRYAHLAAYDHQPMDIASANGHTDVLDWWKNSGLQLRYSEASLELASAKARTPVLDWWKRSCLPLKIGHVMELASGAGHVNVLQWWHASGLDFKYDKIPLYHASCSGKTESLDWWANSGLQLVFDQDALTGATRHNKPESLEWWDKSGLPIQYRLIDIEEALEDAVRGGKEARRWWEKKGVNFNSHFTEWTKLQNLN